MLDFVSVVARRGIVVTDLTIGRVGLLRVLSAEVGESGVAEGFEID